MLRNQSIAKKISLYVALLILAISGILGVFAYQNGSSAVLEEVERALIMVAEDASMYIESEIRIRLSILETLAERPEIKNMVWREQRSVLQSELSRINEFIDLGIVNLDGQITYTDGSTADLANRPHVIGALSGKSLVSDLVISRTDGSVVLLYAVPIRKNGQIIGVLEGRGDGLALNNIVRDLGFGPAGWAHIFGSDGTVFAHPNTEHIFNQDNLFTTTSLLEVGKAVQSVGLGNTGIARFNLEGTNRLNGLAPIPSTGWTVGIGAMEEDVLGNINQMRISLTLIAIFLCFMGVGLAIFIASQIANPLRQVQTVIEAVAEGDLTKTADIRSQDEVGRVATALNTTIASIQNVMRSVTGATDELAGTSQQMAAASEEISASIEEVASTTNQFSSSLDLMAGNAQNMGKNVQEISNKAAQGEAAIEDIVLQINALHNSTRELATNIGDLGSLSDQIGNIVNVIGDIAEQTNLLALNAAIEAARAGEHGRGFAVVADEVRHLAEQSARATTEITSLICRIQTGVSEVVVDMNDGAAQAGTAVKSVDESGEVLRSILVEVEGIVSAVQEISAGLDETNRGGHEIASATQEQAASIEEVASSSQALTDMGLKLQDLVSHFRLND